MPSALVVFSGGQDSTTCLYAAKKAHDEVTALCFDYGQKHIIELESASRIADMVECKLIKMPIPGVLSGTSPLIYHENQVHTYESADVLPGGLENTFVPARNLLFLTIAASVAYAIGADYLYTGVCQADFGGYPDCRQSFIDVAEKAINQALFLPEDERHLSIETPLMNFTKAESVLFAKGLPGCFDALAYSHTCYQGVCPPCGKCHSCLLRSRGFGEAGIEDPLLTRLRGEL